MTNEEIVNKWQKILGLEKYRIKILTTTKDEMIKDWNKPVNGDMNLYIKNKLVIIRMVKSMERTILHELLHVKYPEYSETKVEKLTIEFMKKVKKGEI